MDESSLNHASLKDLADILETALSDSSWSQDDLSAMLRHQMAGRLVVDLTNDGEVSAEDALTVTSMPAPPIETFADLFAHPNPPLRLLLWTKDFAKRCRSDPDSDLPAEVTAVLYFLSVATARVRCSRSITALTMDQIREGLRWVADNHWLDKTTRALVQRLQVAMVDSSH